MNSISEQRQRLDESSPVKALSLPSLSMASTDSSNAAPLATGTTLTSTQPTMTQPAETQTATESSNAASSATPTSLSFGGFNFSGAIPLTAPAATVGSSEFGVVSASLETAAAATDFLPCGPSSNKDFPEKEGYLFRSGIKGTGYYLVPVSFVSAASYTESRPGYIFTTGDLGLGYYLDKRNSATPPDEPTPTGKEFSPEFVEALRRYYLVLDNDTSTEKIDRILEKYKGREKELIEGLVKKYGKPFPEYKPHADVPLKTHSSMKIDEGGPSSLCHSASKIKLKVTPGPLSLSHGANTQEASGQSMLGNGSLQDLVSLHASLCSLDEHDCVARRIDEALIDLIENDQRGFVFQCTDWDTFADGISSEHLISYPELTAALLAESKEKERLESKKLSENPSSENSSEFQQPNETETADIDGHQTQGMELNSGDTPQFVFAHGASSQSSTVVSGDSSIWNTSASGDISMRNTRRAVRKGINSV